MYTGLPVNIDFMTSRLSNRFQRASERLQTMISGERFSSVSVECFQKLTKAYNKTVMDFCGGKYNVI